jgi:hypothetical protein
LGARPAAGLTRFPEAWKRLTTEPNFVFFRLTPRR